MYKNYRPDTEQIRFLKITENNDPKIYGDEILEKVLWCRRVYR